MTFAAMTRVRCGVTTKVRADGAVAEFARDRHHADQRGKERRRRSRRKQRVLVVVRCELVGPRDESVEQHRQQDECDHPDEQAEVGAGGAHLAQFCQQLVGHERLPCGQLEEDVFEARRLGYEFVHGHACVEGNLPDAGRRHTLHQQLTTVEQRRAQPLDFERGLQSLRAGGADADGAAALGGQVREGRDRDKPTSVDDDDVVDRLRDLGEYVAGDKDCLAVGGEATQKVPEPAYALRIETVGGLVEDRPRGRRAAQKRVRAVAASRASSCRRGGDRRWLARPDRAPPRRASLRPVHVRGTKPAVGVAPEREARANRSSRPERPGWKSAASSTAPTRAAGRSRSW